MRRQRSGFGTERSCAHAGTPHGVRPRCGSSEASCQGRYPHPSPSAPVRRDCPRSVGWCERTDRRSPKAGEEALQRQIRSSGVVFRGQSLRSIRIDQMQHQPWFGTRFDARMTREHVLKQRRAGSRLGDQEDQVVAEVIACRQRARSLGVVDGRRFVRQRRGSGGVDMGSQRMMTP